MPPPKPINPLRQNRREISAPTAIRKPAPARPRRACPNKNCATPDINDGICHSCGTIVDDSNIVAEIQFGENSSGAAVVQGSYIGADQGGARTMGGPAFGRMGAPEGSGRENTVREGKSIMTSMANQLTIGENIVLQGVQIFKIAAMNNFIQGRRIDMVAAVCLYSACRKEQPCRVMLIDFADKVQVNVFKLGRTFKDLHDTITISKDGIRPVLPEDLIYRFASKLEFGPMLDKVADDACRMVKRMSFDWMVMGRRPSGVCGACLILAARMNNFRRTITEVVYVVKVTTHTIKKRLTEFKRTATSTLTIEEFLNEEWRASKPHDPPSFYEKTEEFIKTKKVRKRKVGWQSEEEITAAEAHADSANPPNKRQKTGNPAQNPTTPSTEVRRDADGFVIPPLPTQNEDIPIDPLLLQEDAGTAENDEQTRMEREINRELTESIEDLASTYGDETILEESDSESDTEESTENGTNPVNPRKGKKGPDNRPIDVSQEWVAEEDELESEIAEMIADPAMNEAAAGGEIPETPFHIAAGTPRVGAKPPQDPPAVPTPAVPTSTSTLVVLTPASTPAASTPAGSTPTATPVTLTPAGPIPAASMPAVPTPESTFDPHTDAHAVTFEQAALRAEEHMRAAQRKNPSKAVSMDPEIGADEFDDDPEVMNCLLDANASAIKEKIWVNNNREWLRKQQLREYQRQMAENGPPKATRNRKKKPRIGEGQTSAASTPGEAAMNTVKLRAFSKKINYEAISAMFNTSSGGKNGLGSAATSRVTSQAGSALGSRDSSVAPSEDGSEVTTPASAAPPRQRKKAVQEHIEIDSDPDSEDDDYVNPNAPAKSTATAASEPADEDAADEEPSGYGDADDTFQEDENDYGYENGDLDDGFDAASVGEQSNHDFDDDDGY